MNKLIGIASVLLCIMTKTHASQTTHTQTLENEHRDPKSLASLLPKDIVEHTKPFLHSCPVFTINNSVLDEIPVYESNDLSDIKRAKEIVRTHMITQTNAVSIYNTKHNYIYNGNGAAIYLDDGHRKGRLQDVLVAYNPSIEIKGRFEDMDQQPSSDGPFCRYEGFMPGKYYFNFTIQFRGNDAFLQKMFDGTTKSRRTTRIAD